MITAETRSTDNKGEVQVKRTTKYARNLARGVALIALAAPALAYAQDENFVDDDPDAVITQDEAPEYTREEATQAQAGDTGAIVVTARRRDENLQQVPISIGTLDAEALAARNIVGFQDIKSSVANLQTVRTATPGGGYLAIRGLVGLSTPNIAIDSQVGLYIDGVYLGRAQSSGGDITDIAQLEVYRGPQGTLFGKNSTGGAINFITGAPTGEFGGTASFAVGNYGRRFGKMTVNSPNLGGLSFRLSYQHEQYDGDVENEYTGPDYTLDRGFGRVHLADDLGSRNSEAVVAKVRYDGIAGLTVDYKYDYSTTQETPPATQIVGFNSTSSGQIGAGLFVSQPEGRLESSFGRRDSVNQDGTGLVELEVEGHLVNVAYSLSDSMTVKSISAYRTLRSDGPTDLDLGAFVAGGAPLALLHSINLIDQEQFSQEVQLIGEHSSFDYVLGGFYFDEQADQTQLQGGGFPLIPAADGFVNVPLSAVNQDDHTDNQAYAVYGSLSWRPLAALELSGGVRYTWDRKETVRTITAPVTGTFDDEQLTYDVSARYEILPGINAYARFAHGYNAGGFANGMAYGAEETDSYEGGLKTELFDGRLRLNGTYFRADTTDLQRARFVPGQGVMYFNVGESKVQGVEIEASATPFPGLTLSANYGLVDAEFSDGSALSVPDENLALSATYDSPTLLSDAYLSIRLDADYRSSYYSSNLTRLEDRTIPVPGPGEDLDNNGVPDSVQLPASIYTSMGFADQFEYNEALMKALTAGDYWLANARVSLMDIPVGPTRMRLSGYVKNIFDEDAVSYPIDYGVIAGAIFERPRTYGIELGITF